MRKILYVIGKLEMIMDGFHANNKITKKVSPLLSNAVWDIYLSTISDYKQKIVKESQLKGNFRRYILCTSLPKYIWIASLFVSKKKIIDLLFDATDISHGPLFIGAIVYSKPEAKPLKEITMGIKNDRYEDIEFQSVLDSIQNWIKKFYY